MALDALGRLHPLFFDVLARGHEGVLVTSLCSLPLAIAALGAFDPAKARYYRGILTGRVEEGAAIEAPNWQGVRVEVSEANKWDTIRRDCEDVLVRRCADAWELLRRGFLLGGGQVVLDAMAAEGLGGSSFKPLVYDPRAREARAARMVAQVAEDDAFVGRNSKLCPSCGVKCIKDGGCQHFRCRCGVTWNWCCGRVQAGHPAHGCPNGGRIE